MLLIDILKKRCYHLLCVPMYAEKFSFSSHQCFPVSPSFENLNPVQKYILSISFKKVIICVLKIRPLNQITTTGNLIRVISRHRGLAVYALQPVDLLVCSSFKFLAYASLAI